MPDDDWWSGQAFDDGLIVVNDVGDAFAVHWGRIFADFLRSAVVDSWPAGGEDLVTKRLIMRDPALPGKGRHPEAMNEEYCGLIAAGHGRR